MSRPLTHRALWALFAATLVGCHAPQGLLRVATNTPKPTPGPWAGAKPSAAPAATATPAVVPDQLIVALKPGVTPETWLAQPKTAGFTLRGAIRLSGRHVLKVGIPKALDRDAARLLAAETEGVQRVTEDPVPRTAAFTFTQKDTRFDEQWAHLARHGNTLDAWEKVPLADQAKIIVAVLDTGLDVAHPEFAGRVVGARNFTAQTPDADVTDTQGHGTHVTGIVGATGNNNVGVAGVAWGVQLMPVKVLGDSGQGGTFDILQGILYASSFVPSPDDGSRVRVINMSLGTPTGGTDALYAEAIAQAHSAGVLVVAATGNDGRGIVGQPATTPHALAVGATARYLNWESLAAFSNYGDRLDLVAPGEDILSTFPTAGSGMGQTYGMASGTSMASPYVAGVAALVAAKYDKANASLTSAFATKLRTRLIASSDDMGAPGWDPIYGAGRLNANRAVTPANIDAAP
jgi:hypothetical protein